MGTWARVGILVTDDFPIRCLNPDQAADLLEVIEDRAGLRSTIVTSLHYRSRYGTRRWATIADAILDRLLENAHRIELAGADPSQ